MLTLQRLARFLEGHAVGDVMGSEAGQLGTEGTDRRALWPDKEAVPFTALEGDGVDDTQPDFNDLADLSWRRRPLPTGRLDIHDVEETSELFHLPTLPVMEPGLRTGTVQLGPEWWCARPVSSSQD